MLHLLMKLTPRLWFRDLRDPVLMLNDTAVRIRAGLMLAIPIYMGYTLYDAIFGGNWTVTGNIVTDTFDTDFDGRILYMVEAVRRTYDYTLQSHVLEYALFEMFAGMFAWLAWLSPTVWIAALLARRSPPVWKPVAPKRFAWALGASFIATCWVFFNPEVFAGWVNTVARSELLPTTQNYMPRWIPLTLVLTCTGLMWMETVLGFCLGCKLHSLFVRFGWIQDECEACNNLDFSRY